MAKRKASIFLPIIFIILSLSISFNIIFGIREWRRDVVVRVSDGDTFTLADGRRVRLLGVDAPEMGRCMSEEAKARLSELVLGKYVRLKDIGHHDDYGRILASVLVDAPFDKWMEYLYFRFVRKAPYKNLVMINRVMVEEGLGLYHNSGGQYTEVLSGASQLARTGKLGIYSETCTQISPKNPTCLIKANIRNNKKTYFLPSCFNYADVTISTSFGDAWFCSEKEALSAGFTKSVTCR
ncbi:MAG: Nuclease (SNase domain protein) [Microgenomates group bacterium GW2011_GWB1_40_9]|nr:MAG: Nuclease (SNase domain protein) [Microgenomates group bacterium GW2011_GWB1_40_9]